jgi:hypothetical protein
MDKFSFVDTTFVSNVSNDTLEEAESTIKDFDNNNSYGGSYCVIA